MRPQHASTFSRPFHAFSRRCLAKPKPINQDKEALGLITSLIKYTNEEDIFFVILTLLELQEKGLILYFNVCDSQSGESDEKTILSNCFISSTDTGNITTHEIRGVIMAHDIDEPVDEPVDELVGGTVAEQEVLNQACHEYLQALNTVESLKNQLVPLQLNLDKQTAILDEKVNKLRKNMLKAFRFSFSPSIDQLHSKVSTATAAIFELQPLYKNAIEVFEKKKKVYNDALQAYNKAIQKQTDEQPFFEELRKLPHTILGLIGENLFKDKIVDDLKFNNNSYLFTNKFQGDKYTYFNQLDRITEYINTKPGWDQKSVKQVITSLVNERLVWSPDENIPEFAKITPDLINTNSNEIFSRLFANGNIDINDKLLHHFRSIVLHDQRSRFLGIIDSIDKQIDYAVENNNVIITTSVNKEVVVPKKQNIHWFDFTIYCSNNKLVYKCQSETQDLEIIDLNDAKRIIRRFYLEKFVLDSKVDNIFAILKDINISITLQNNMGGGNNIARLFRKYCTI